MAENPFIPPLVPTPPPLTSIDRDAIARADPTIQNGASWFWWIAGLSLVNTAIIHAGGEINFVIGLGFTLVADTILKEHFIIALAIDVIAIGLFFTLGFFSRKGHLWAFITGIALYTLDALIYVLAGDLLSIAFHGLALFYLFRGAKSLHAGLKAAATPTSTPAAPPVLPS